MTTAAVDTNISDLPAADQARTDITTTGTTTTVSVTGPALSDLVVTTNNNGPNLVLDGSFRSSAFIDDAQIQNRWTVTSGNKTTKTTFRLGKDSFDDVIKFKKGAKAKKCRIADFKEGDKLKYKGKTYKYDDISGKGFDGLSKKQIKLV